MRHHGRSARILSRVGGALFAIFGASVISFIFLRVAPGDPARLLLGPLASPASVKALSDELGLNEGIPAQYLHYISSFLQGDWGFSFSNGDSVSSLFVERIPATIELGVFAFFIAAALALTLSVLSTYRRRPLVDRVVQGFVHVGLGTPPFWLGLLLLILFFEHLHLLPGPEGQLSSEVPPPPTVTHFMTVDAVLAGDWEALGDAFLHLLLPAITLAVVPAAYLTRLLRTNLLEISGERFLVTVRSKGVSRWRTSVRHALPNAVLPTLTAAGPVFAELLAGSVFVETVFNWPGIGQLTAQAILRQDYSVVQAFVLLSATVYVTLSLLVDLLYGVIDPRVRSGSVLR